MAYKIFLDTNVLIDAFSENREGYGDATELFGKIYKRELQATVSPAIIYMVCYLLRKDKTQPWLRGMWTSLLDYVEVIEMNHTFALQALHAAIPDIEDALQYFAAIQHRCTHFISSDKGLKKAATTQLPVLTSKQFLSLLK